MQLSTGPFPWGASAAVMGVCPGLSRTVGRLRYNCPVGNERVKCLDCEAMFDPSPSGRGPRRQRCDLHRALRKSQLQRARTAQLRAVEWGVVAELVIAYEVFERDDWVCHLCGELVPERLRTPEFRAGAYEPMYPVVDHVIPLSKGGPHTMSNCATAHWTCNAQKFDSDGLAELESTPQAVAVNEHSGEPCEIEGCLKPIFTKGMCQNHYNRNRKHGHPLKMKCGCGCGEIVIVPPDWTGLFYIDGHGVQYGTTEPAEKLRRSRAAEPVSERGRELYGLTDDCLIWTGTRTKKGYGIINWRVAKGIMASELVHRYAYELAHGVGSASDLTVDHLCGVPLCCNPNHLEAVPLAENISRAALAVTACPQGHPYDEKNTLYAGDNGYRICRQCNRNPHHLREFGHDFIPDPQNRSTKRASCLTCRLEKESKPQFCPHRHEYSPENTKFDSKGRRLCAQCQLTRRHTLQYGHEFVVDPSNNSKKRRCLICVQAAVPVTHCSHGHEYTELTLEFSRKGHRKCVQCRLNKAHVPDYGHEYAIDPKYTPGSTRRCMICEQRKQDELPTHCVNGHKFTLLTTEYHSTRGNRICVQCRLDATHIPQRGHAYVIDPEHVGKLRRCLICTRAKSH